MKMRVKKNLSEFVDCGYIFVITQEMLQFAGKIIEIYEWRDGGDWYGHDYTGKGYCFVWHKTWLEPVEEEMSFEEAYDLVCDNETVYFMYSKEKIFEIAKAIKGREDE